MSTQEIKEDRRRWPCVWSLPNSKSSVDGTLPHSNFTEFIVGKSHSSVTCGEQLKSEMSLFSSYFALLKKID